MRIGIFDSGLGGLVLSRAIIQKMPQYDYVYLGDTARVPYGNRSKETIYEFTKQAIIKLFEQNCQIVILACNTASAQALRKIQRHFLPKNYPDRRVLGVIIPTLEAIDSSHKNIGIIATLGTVKSKIYERELKKLWPKVKVSQQAAPLLVPLVENNELDKARPFLQEYLKPLLTKNIDTLILGCTHYPLLINQIAKIIGPKVKIICQTDVVPEKLAIYFSRHSEIERKLSKNKLKIFEVTDLNQDFIRVSKMLFGKSIKFKLVKY